MPWSGVASCALAAAGAVMLSLAVYYAGIHSYLYLGLCMLLQAPVGIGFILGVAGLFGRRPRRGAVVGTLANLLISAASGALVVWTRR